VEHRWSDSSAGAAATSSSKRAVNASRASPAAWKSYSMRFTSSRLTDRSWTAASGLVGSWNESASFGPISCVSASSAQSIQAFAAFGSGPFATSATPPIS
jgi:hypothetical protein